MEKKPLYHFLPGSLSFSIATAGCNLACLNCQNWEISRKSPNETRNIELFPEKAVEEALKNGCDSIAFTYTEPTVFYEYAFDTARLAKARGVKNLLISNGFINEKPLMDLSKYLDAANIDLKSFSEATYHELTGGRLKPILNTLKILKAEGVWLEITRLIIPGRTDDMDNIREMCEWLILNGFADTPMHFTRFYPFHKLPDVPYTPFETLEMARNIAVNSGIQYVYSGNVPGNYAENTYCPVCKEKLIERQGYNILSMNINDGLCKFCNTKITGVWGSG
ncbi:MAG: AmmeMemoRadiSam system radical SAM enzyme [Bacteroidetes bacterium]|nr:AmmeMemoRadiSam system radical SAM enzyme [Bacteroidota bacterium]